ncbi:tRNA (adenosine(37)-N6)-dimethylallyltransferase MiaA [Mesonia hippocampi]|uniref:tRNA (adenosine(37)-N6)-dimethylallyltransferase MiaA n=3 Tax=Mesonia hippocampi TaxID=1628250 RepID=UPI003F9D4FDC
MNNILLSIIGPTAIGKTSLAIQLAKEYQSDIISADSRQFFQEMNIGTAVPSKQELEMAKHHFIQHISIQQEYTVGDFEKDALNKLDYLFTKNNPQIMVGGSGLYIDAVINGLDKFPKVNPEIRTQLNSDLKEKGLPYLQQQLNVLDPITANKIALDNPQRVIRALEICIGTNKPYSSFINQPKEKRNFTPIKIGLTAPRDIIYQRIEQRVDIMMNNGLLEEVKKLLPYKNLNALNTVGYKELFLYLENKCSLETALDEIKKNTRRFAKRQLTWFRKDKNITWFDVTTNPLEDILTFVNQKTAPQD